MRLTLAVTRMSVYRRVETVGSAMRFVSFIGGNFRWLFGGFLLTFCSAFGQTFFIALSAGDIRTEYNLSHGEFGNLYMIATLASALTLPWAGKIVDRIGPAPVALIIMPALALACLGMALSTHIITLLLAIYMLRLFGQGMMTQNALTATGRWFVANRGRAVSVVALGHNASEALLPIVFVLLLAMIGWRDVWLVSAVFLVLVALPIIFVLLRKERTPQSADLEKSAGGDRNWTRGEVLSDHLFWVLLAGVLAPPTIGTVILFHQVYLVELRGWSLEVFVASFSVMAMCTIVFALVSGWLIDRFSAVRMLPFFLVPLAFACFILANVSASWAPFAFMSIMGISYGFSSTLFGALWPEIYGTKHLGAVRSIVLSAMVFATAAGPGATGMLIDWGVSYPAQIGAMGIYCLAVCLVMVWIVTQLRARVDADLAI
ncbi:MAG: MFS transporter [Pseudomonadota bacterium]